jgi:hypothetical protein
MIIVGITDKSMTRDKDGHRDYKITFRVKGTVTNGPAGALSCPGLPLPGSAWNFYGDYDPWATCKLENSVTPVMKGENNTQWDIQFTFSTRGDEKRCKDAQIEDPLLTPPQVSGSGQKYNEEIAYDRFDQPVVNSAWEQLRGPQVEFDANRSTIRIKMNVSSFSYIILAEAMRDHVNMFPLWGFPKRCVKLSHTPWETKFYGNCYKYYTLDLEFDTNSKTFDRDLLDEGTKVLNGHWDSLSDQWIVDKIGGINRPAKMNIKVTPTGGTVQVGTYDYVVTAQNATGSTLASDVVTATITNNQSIVNITWPKIPGALTYNIFVRPLAGQWHLLDHTPDPNPFYKDDGSKHPGTLQDPPETDTTGGIDPDPRNPKHFIRFKDRHGENARVILDGGGLPAGVVSTGHDAFLCISFEQITDEPTTDTRFWLAIEGSITGGNWDSSTVYIPGEIVWINAGQDENDRTKWQYYVCIVGNTGTDPVFNATKWRPIGDSPPRPRGAYNSEANYHLGEYVQVPPNAGTIHVEHYNEADFVLLGIPTIL